MICSSLPVVFATVPYSSNIAPARAADSFLVTTTKMEGAVGISPDTLASFLSCHDQSTLVLDCRPFMSYNTGHVVEAVNVHCPPILKRRSGGFVALENIVPDACRRERLQRGGFESVVVYDQGTHDLAQANTDSNLYSVVKSLIQQVDLDRVYYLVGGYDAFTEECPLLCATQQFSLLSAGRPEVQQAAPNDQPVAEILPHLFLGDVNHSSSRELLQRLGVTALVNVSTSCANHFQSDFRYLHIAVKDSASEDLAAWFDCANHFIDQVQSEGGRVLVHCHAGRSRSATICLAYLMKTLDMSLDNAFEHVRSRREVIDPNLNFMQQLQNYRKQLDRERQPCSISVPSTPLGTPPRLSFQSPPRTPREAPAPISLPSASELSLMPPANSAADIPPPSPAMASNFHCRFSFSSADLPPPSPSTATDVQCHFSFSNTEFPFPSGSLARTPEIPLPS